MKCQGAPGFGLSPWPTIAFLLVATVVGFSPTVAEQAESRRPAATCDQRTAMQIAIDLKTKAQKGIPDCPEARSLDPSVTGSGPSTLTDTGLTRCRVRTADVVVECPRGLTIHIETKPCRCRQCKDGKRDDGSVEECETTAIVDVACRVHYL